MVVGEGKPQQDTLRERALRVRELALALLNVLERPMDEKGMAEVEQERACWLLGTVEESIAILGQAETALNVASKELIQLKDVMG